MPSSSTVTTSPQTASQRLSEYIRVVRENAEQVSMASSGVQYLALPKLYLHMFQTDHIMIAIERDWDWTNNDTEALEFRIWESAFDANEIIVPLIIQIITRLNPDEKVNQNPFKTPGSDPWRRAYTAMRLMVESYHPCKNPEQAVHTCPICFESFIINDFFIQLPCHITHRLHEHCLVELTNELSLLDRDPFCPYCRGSLETPTVI